MSEGLTSYQQLQGHMHHDLESHPTEGDEDKTWVLVFKV